MGSPAVLDDLTLGGRLQRRARRRLALSDEAFNAASTHSASRTAAASCRATAFLAARRGMRSLPAAALTSASATGHTSVPSVRAEWSSPLLKRARCRAWALGLRRARDAASAVSRSGCLPQANGLEARAWRCVACSSHHRAQCLRPPCRRDGRSSNGHTREFDTPHQARARTCGWSLDTRRQRRATMRKPRSPTSSGAQGGGGLRKSRRKSPKSPLQGHGATRVVSKARLCPFEAALFTLKTGELSRSRAHAVRISASGARHPERASSRSGRERAVRGGSPRRGGGAAKAKADIEAALHTAAISWRKPTLGPLR